jgi:hypothetical protein
MPASTMHKLEGPTTTVPVAGQLLGLSRNKAYEAAARGEIPTLKFGKRMVVPTMPLRRMLGLDLVSPTLPSAGSDDCE